MHSLDGDAGSCMIDFAFRGGDLQSCGRRRYCMIDGKEVGVTVNVASEDEQRADGRASRVAPTAGRDDLDGTIIGPEGEISDRTVRALRRVEELGVPVVFVTGRPPRWLRVVSERTGHTGLAICANGAIVYDLHTEQVVAHHPIAVEIGLRSPSAAGGRCLTSPSPSRPSTAMRAKHAYRPVGTSASSNPRLHRQDLCRHHVKLLIRHESMDADRLLAAHARSWETSPSSPTRRPRAARGVRTRVSKQRPWRSCAPNEASTPPT
jgi:hypothetical protein